PIPNREVKPACADGTAMQCGRVGGRHLLFENPGSLVTESRGFFFHHFLIANIFFTFIETQHIERPIS
ncbi:MAG: hypothetical protein IJT53_04335, partial [Prevotella sp.]|nr:hypothetical protein [Prevotella sp.]